MQHPFHDVMPAGEPQHSRRSALGRLLAAAAALLGMTAAGCSTTQSSVNARTPTGQVSTMALGEEGGSQSPTTLAVGEEGGGGSATTFAMGEEGGGG